MKKLLAMVCVLMSVPSASFAYVCPRTYPMAVHYTLFETANGAISQGIAQVDIGLSSLLNYYSPRVEAALATLAKQKAYSSKQIADVTRAVAQQIANARKATSKKTRHIKARYDYGSEFGQGYEPCLQVAVRQAMTTRQTDMDAIRSQRVTTEVLGGPGNYRNQTQARRELMQANRKFCTQDQVDSGFCDVVGGFPGASVNVTTLFQSAPDDNPITEAKNTVINNMIGLPDDEIMKGSENSAQTAAYAFPAHAGMNRRDSIWQHRNDCVPRACGDEPREGKARLPIKSQKVEIADPGSDYLQDDLIESAEFRARFLQVFEHELTWRMRKQ